MISINRLFSYAILALFLLGTLSSCEGMKESTKKHSPQDTATYTKGNLEVAISYSKPYKKGRIIFGTEEEGALAPYGEVWRTGANEATQIKLSEEITINGKNLPAGTYTMYTIPGPDTWTLAINSRLDYWGKSLIGSPFNSDDDMLRVEGTVEQMEEEMEQFSIDFKEEGDMVYIRFMWDQTLVKVPFRP